MKEYRPYIWLLIACSAASFGWFFVSIWMDESTHAGRGGSIGVALSFFTLFLKSRDYYHSIDAIDSVSKEALSSLNTILSDQEQVRQNARRIDALKRDLERARKRNRRENVILSISSAVSSIVWGFGDQVAGWLV